VVDVSSRQPEKGEEVAVFNTSRGQIVLMFFPEFAPNHVANFKSLVQKGFYDKTKFHRCIPGFMIQGGDPNTKSLDAPGQWGMGGNRDEKGESVNLKAEFNPITHKRGVLSMARASDPNSASSQFFIMHGDSSRLDWNYSAFGKVVSGMDIVDRIVTTGSTDRSQNGKVEPRVAVEIISARISKWPDL
jgi:peptidyl-prolyl cis-trans isomerase B (cyclophilin B)